MIKVGITGGIASGKSLVSAEFRTLGADVSDADKIAHGLIEPHQPAWDEIVSRFGKNILQPDQRIDRKRLGEIVFSSEQDRLWLNRCLHPRVFEAFAQHVSNLTALPKNAIVALDAALLIESGFHRSVDVVIVVFAEEEQQISRLMQRDDFTREQAFARVKSQMPLIEKKRFANYVIDNSGTQAAALEQTRTIYSRLRKETENKS
jgi:dephospho-CoA kinase